MTTLALNVHRILNYNAKLNKLTICEDVGTSKPAGPLGYPVGTYVSYDYLLR